VRPATARWQFGDVAQRPFVRRGSGERGGKQLTAEARHLTPLGIAVRIGQTHKSVADAMNMVD
jgi:hypothetical protein